MMIILIDDEMCIIECLTSLSSPKSSSTSTIVAELGILGSL